MLGSLDLNQNLDIQSVLCCQLHHSPVHWNAQIRSLAQHSPDDAREQRIGQRRAEVLGTVHAALGAQNPDL